MKGKGAPYAVVSIFGPRHCAIAAPHSLNAIVISISIEAAERGRCVLVNQVSWGAVAGAAIVIVVSVSERTFSIFGKFNLRENYRMDVLGTMAP